MKRFKLIAVILTCVLCLAFVLTGCNNSNDNNSSNNGESNGNQITQPDDTPKDDSNILIAFFSRADENYGVGNIEKGNTHILAEMIQAEVGGTLFHIQRATPYPVVYSECTAEAQSEKNANSRPALLNTIDISEYDVIFIGYPIWWGDMPMPVYTFIESQDWNGKTVIPFSTNEGSGLAGTVSTISAKCSGATVLDALSMRGTTAQNNQSQARQSVRNWLNGLAI